MAEIDDRDDSQPLHLMEHKVREFPVVTVGSEVHAEIGGTVAQVAYAELSHEAQVIPPVLVMERPLELIHPNGLAVPDPLTVNVAKLHFATNYHQAVARLQDIAGGLLVTAPAEEDLAAPELGDAVRRYLGGKLGLDTDARLRALNLASDLTASDFGGYQEVLAVHAEGSIEAEKLTILRNYDTAAAKAYAKELAGIS